MAIEVYIDELEEVDDDEEDKVEDVTPEQDVTPEVEDAPKRARIVAEVKVCIPSLLLLSIT